MEELQAKVKEQRETDELFVLACARGLLDNAETLLSQGANVNALDSDGRRSTHHAAFKGELEVLQLLSSKGADLDAEDPDGRSPVQYAALVDNVPCVEFLASKGCWLDSFDRHDNTALHLAAQHGACAAARCLLRLGAKRALVNQRGLTPLGEAIVTGNVKLCDDLASADVRQELAQLRPRGYSLLHVAAACGEPLAVKWLLDKGANVGDAANRELLTPLHSAVMGGNVIVVEQLVAAGADLTARNANGEMPVDLVASVAEQADLPQHRSKLVQALKSGQPARADAAAAEPPQTSAAPQDGATQPADAERPRAGQPPLGQAGMPTAAERLQNATTPEEVAAVMARLPRDHQLLRLSKWVALDGPSLASSGALTAAAKRCILQVKELTQYLARLRAIAALQQDEYFQGDMRNASVRASVDAVIADPNLVMRYLQQPDVMACLNKMRALRDVLKANGGGPINMDEILTPWSEAAMQKTRDVSGALDSAIDSALTVILLPDEHSGGQDGPTLPAALQLKDSLGSRTFADEEESSSAHGKRDPGLAEASDTPSWMPLLQLIGRQLLQSVVVMSALMLVMWWQGRLPWQRKSRLDSNGITPTTTDNMEL